MPGYSETRETGINDGLKLGFDAAGQGMFLIGLIEAICLAMFDACAQTR
jgi:hypothetical protein